MEISIDTKTISEAGFDTYLSRPIFGNTPVGSNLSARYTDASSLVGGVIGSEGIIYLGSKQIKLDGRNKRIVISDGVNDRILIGYQANGF